MNKIERIFKAVSKINMSNFIILAIVTAWFVSYHYGVFYRHELTAGQEKSLERLDFLMNFICGVVIGKTGSEIKNNYNSVCESCGTEMK